MNESVLPCACGRERLTTQRRFLRLTLLSGVLLALVAGDAAAQRAVDPEQGIVGVSRLLRGLGSVKRVLIIGAHPDDEDTALLTWLERGSGADAAYLSLNRGEGGQNLIGPELGVGLGLVRTGELLAARRLDGAEQYFTRAYDFGYSKSATETFRFWPQDSLLADVVAIVRQFRPQVVVSIFTGTPRDGHGQHQAAGILAREAFKAAGDPQRFPEQLAEGLRPWSPLKLYRSTRFDRDATTLEVGTGRLDPLYGRSYHQIAMASRSQHRSQDMGRIESLGPRSTALELIESTITPGEAADGSLFAGIDTSLAGMLTVIDDEAARQSLARSLEEYDANLQRARESLGSTGTREVVADLSSALERLRLAVELADRAGPGSGELRFALGAQERRLEAALAAAAGVIVDAFADDDLIVPGQNVEIEVQIWNGGEDIVEVRRVVLRTPAGTEDAAAPPIPREYPCRRRVDAAVLLAGPA
jgi:LmbE family N-acetylglucosaminyl deacetylase